jgi:hypothetical protein
MSQVWPPPSFQPMLVNMQEWRAWYSGETDRLDNVGTRHGVSSASGFRGTVLRVWARFWGTRPSGQEHSLRVHVPLAADIARATADMLFAEPPTMKAEDPEPLDENGNPVPETLLAIEQQITDATTELIETYAVNGMLVELASAAEVGAALGGVYLRAVADLKTKRVCLSRVDHHMAIPTFRFNELESVRFWRKLGEQGGITYWHIETHLVNAAGVGVVRHELFEGTEETLTIPIPLADRPETRDLVVDQNSEISTRTPGLDVVYIPNNLPNPLWLDLPDGARMGAPDIAGSEDLLDRLDHAFSLMLREADLARARAMVADSALKDFGVGMGRGFDSNQELFTPLRLPPPDPNSNNPGNMVQLIQPEMRVEKWLVLCQEITEVILRRSGHSAATFGEDESAASTATETNSKNKRSATSRLRKSRIWATELRAILQKMLAMDVAFGWVPPGTIDPLRVVVSFPMPSASPTELAQTVQALRSVQAMSMETAVRRANPAWTDRQVDEEVQAILEEQKATAALAPAAVDPFATPVEDPGATAGGLDAIPGADAPLPTEQVVTDQQQAVPAV